MMELVLRENPNDRAAKYSVANLLLATGRQIERAGRLAKELYEDDPRSLGNAALYAFSLHLQGNPDKGADLLDSRDDVGQLGSEGAAYYALLLSACGRRDEARRALTAVDRHLLLPELRASLDRCSGLFRRTRQLLPRRNRSPAERSRLRLPRKSGHLPGSPPSYRCSASGTPHVPGELTSPPRNHKILRESIAA